MSVEDLSVFHEALCPPWGKIKRALLSQVKDISRELLRALFMGPLVFEEHRNSQSHIQDGLTLEQREVTALGRPSHPELPRHGMVNFPWVRQGNLEKILRHLPQRTIGSGRAGQVRKIVKRAKVRETLYTAWPLRDWVLDWIAHFVTWEWTEKLRDLPKIFSQSKEKQATAGLHGQSRRRSLFTPNRWIGNVRINALWQSAW